jgi:hypothetical protein
MHHRWFVEKSLGPSDGSLLFTMKSPMLSQLPALHCPRPEKEFLDFFWEDSFSFTEKLLFHESEIVDDLLRFRKSLAVSEAEKEKISHALATTHRGHQTSKTLWERLVHFTSRKAYEFFVWQYR